MRADRFRLIVGVSLTAGVMDLVTGLGLILTPAFLFALLGGSPSGEAAPAVWLRTIGAFVGGVGSSYLWALASAQATVRAQRLPGVWGATAIVRAAVASWCIIAVATGALDARWLLVAATDGTLAVLQATALRRGWFAP